MRLRSAEVVRAGFLVIRARPARDRRLLALQPPEVVAVRDWVREPQADRVAVAAADQVLGAQEIRPRHRHRKVILEGLRQPQEQRQLICGAQAVAVAAMPLRDLLA